MTAVIGIIGLCVALTGGYYLLKERHDRESVKIYGLVCAVGIAVLALAAAAMLR